MYTLYGLQAAIDGQFIAAVTNKKLPCALQLEASPLQLLMLHSGSSPSLPFTYLNLVALLLDKFGDKFVKLIQTATPFVVISFSMLLNFVKA